MTNITKLSSKTISLIAAGEVVERPMNIVKELVENAIDSEASEITIIIKNGGLDMISVKDNGFGMDSESLTIAFDLHTTSKLSNSKIHEVRTLGFRGEALASISSISRIECNSKGENTNVQNQITIEGGKVLNFRLNKNSLEGSGTTITVTGLFHNTPVRRKFLKKPTTERKRIFELITHFALTYPTLHFILDEEIENRYKRRLNSPSRQSLLAVIYDVLGSNIAVDLIPINEKLGEWVVTGYISKPNLFRSDRSVQYICVNGRIVRHNELQKSVEKSYGSQLMKSAHPILVLILSGAVDLVDFNVHPQKSEIRFRTSDTIIQDMSALIKSVLDSRTELPTLHTTKRPLNAPINERNKIRHANKIQIEDLAILEPNEILSNTDADSYNDNSLSSITDYHQLSLDEENVTVSSAGIEILGHVMGKFALALAKDELWLIDVHAADERVKFEYYERSSKRTSLSQQMLEPIPISLLPTELEFLMDNYAALVKFGFNISRGGKNQMLVHSVPVYYDQDVTIEGIKKLISDLSSFLSETGDEDSLVESPLSNIEYGIVARLACHGSIRSGIQISKNEIAKVIDNLLKCNNPWTCAHGRPTVLRLPKSRLEGWFRR